MGLSELLKQKEWNPKVNKKHRKGNWPEQTIPKGYYPNDLDNQKQEKENLN